MLSVVGALHVAEDCALSHWRESMTASTAPVAVIRETITVPEHKHAGGVVRSTLQIPEIAAGGATMQAHPSHRARYNPIRLLDAQSE